MKFKLLSSLKKRKVFSLIEKREYYMQNKLPENLWKWFDLEAQSTSEPDIEDFENDILSKIDTFIRETLQNSSDATKDGQTTEMIFKRGRANITRFENIKRT